MEFEWNTETPPEPPPPAKPGPWGPLASIALTFLIGAAYVLASIITSAIMIAAAVSFDPSFDPDEFVNTLESNGLFLAVSTIIGAAFALPLVFLFVYARRDPPVREYLALRLPRLGDAIAWTVGFLLFLVLSDLLTASMDRGVVPEFMTDIYKSAEVLPLLIFALVIAAPFGEEFVFRGFLFAGLRESRLGSTGAIIITAAMFASLHLQYDLHGMVIVFCVGVLLGHIRHKTESLLFCVGLHGLMNFLATLQVAYLVSETQ